MIFFKRAGDQPGMGNDCKTIERNIILKVLLLKLNVSKNCFILLSQFKSNAIQNCLSFVKQ